MDKDEQREAEEFKKDLGDELGKRMSRHKFWVRVDDAMVAVFAIGICFVLWKLFRFIFGGE